MNKTVGSDVDQSNGRGGDTSTDVKVFVCIHWMTV